MRKQKDRFFLMKALYDILYCNYGFNPDHIIEYLDRKSINQLEDMLHYLMYDNISDVDNKVIKDFVTWEDENIIKLELLENMLDNLEYSVNRYNEIEVMQFLNSLSMGERHYFYNYCLIDEICEEFEHWRTKNELSQNN